MSDGKSQKNQKTLINHVQGKNVMTGFSKEIVKVKIQWNKFKEKNRSTKDSMSHKIFKKIKAK